MPSFFFDNYMYSAVSTRYNKSGSAAASIDLISSANSSASAALYFYYDEASSNRAPIQSGSRILLSYHVSMLDTIIDMLRNEDSTYLFYDIPNGLGYLTTNKEPVGEEET